MSVINQMLKELDQRTNNNQSRPVMLNGNNQQYSQNIDKTYSLKIIISATLFVITLTASYAFFNQKDDLSNLSSLEKVPVTNHYNSGETLTSSDLKAKDSSQPLNANLDDSMILAIQIPESEDIGSQASDRQISDFQPEESNSIVPDINPAKKVIKSKPQLNSKAQAQKLLVSARSDLDRGNKSLAKAKLKKALSLDNNLHSSRVLLLSVLLEQQQIEAMDKILKVSLVQWPDIHQYRQMQARLFMQQEKYKDAVALLKQNIPQIRLAPAYHALLAYAAQQALDDELASKHYQLLLQLQPDRANIWLGFAVSEERLGNKEMALKAYQQSISRPGLSQTVGDYARQRIKVIQGF